MQTKANTRLGYTHGDVYFVNIASCRGDKCLTKLLAIQIMRMTEPAVK